MALTAALVMVTAAPAGACEFHEGCMSNDECGGGMICSDGMCIEAECQSDGDCVEIYGAGFGCLVGNVVSECRKKTDGQLCTETGGTWNECAHGSCPTCTDCIGACTFPNATPDALCTQSGGEWNLCAKSSCDMCLDCIADCVCPMGQVMLNGSCANPENHDPKKDDSAAFSGSPANTGCTVTGQGRSSAAPLLFLALALIALRRPRSA
jgi:MYXO-CTERM domain-containing protein